MDSSSSTKTIQDLDLCWNFWPGNSFSLFCSTDWESTCTDGCGGRRWCWCGGWIVVNDFDTWRCCTKCSKIYAIVIICYSLNSVFMTVWLRKMVIVYFPFRCAKEDCCIVALLHHASRRMRVNVQCLLFECAGGLTQINSMKIVWSYWLLTGFRALMFLSLRWCCGLKSQRRLRFHTWDYI